MRDARRGNGASFARLHRRGRACAYVAMVGFEGRLIGGRFRTEGV
jgi:hypothetical protein